MSSTDGGSTSILAAAAKVTVTAKMELVNSSMMRDVHNRFFVLTLFTFHYAGG